MTSRLFGAGFEGPALTADEWRILQRHPPRAVILFARNIETPGQLEGLVARLQSLPGPPFVCIDQEGGPVDRFRSVLGPSISLRGAARTGDARRAGELAGEACARFGIAVDLAPVVDLALPGAGERILGERSAGKTLEDVLYAAGEFLDGLHALGVGGCLKHFPGLGRAALDTHSALPILPEDPEGEERDLAPFRRLAQKARAVMISHAARGDATPSSLSPTAATDLLRGSLGFDGAAFSDDLEMGALDAFGDLPRRCVLASRAGCDLLFVCRRTETLPGCVAAVQSEVPLKRRAEAEARLDAYERHLRALARTQPPLRPLEELSAEIRALSEREPGSTGPA